MKHLFTPIQILILSQLAVAACGSGQNSAVAESPTPVKTADAATAAAHAVAEQAASCPIPELAADLMTIAEDEARHAALAFDTVAWLLTQSPALQATLAGLVRSFVAEADERQQALVGPILQNLWPSRSTATMQTGDRATCS